MAGHQPHRNPDDFLYHYTTTAGLIGILTSGRIRATSAEFLNDGSELVYGANHAAALLLSNAKDLSLPEYVRSELESCCEAVENVPNEYISQFPYVACFSARRDDLSQWRGYAAGGYCIAFHREALATGISPTAQTSAAGLESVNPELGQIRYGADCEPFLRGKVGELRDALVDHGPPAKVGGIRTYFVVQDLLTPHLVLTKDPAFAAETEWRIVVLQGDPVQFVPSDLGPVTYVEIEFDRGAVAEVMAGPGANIDRRARAAARLLEKAGYNAVQARRSKIPYIGAR